MLRRLNILSRKNLMQCGLQEYKEFIHFALTSQDVNNTATPLSLKDAMTQVYYPVLDELLRMLVREGRGVVRHSHAWKDPWTACFPDTNGQGNKGISWNGLKSSRTCLRTIPYSAKFGGATGNFNAHHVAYPEVDWVLFADRFLGDKLGLDKAEDHHTD